MLHCRQLVFACTSCVCWMLKIPTCLNCLSCSNSSVGLTCLIGLLGVACPTWLTRWKCWTCLVGLACLTNLPGVACPTWLTYRACWACLAFSICQFFSFWLIQLAYFIRNVTYLTRSAWSTCLTYSIFLTGLACLSCLTCLVRLTYVLCLTLVGFYGEPFLGLTLSC